MNNIKKRFLYIFILTHHKYFLKKKKKTKKILTSLIFEDYLLKIFLNKI